MKPIIPILLVLAAVQFSSAQKVEKYFDHSWKECAPANARYYSLTLKTDSGWARKDYYIRERKRQMEGLYADAECKIKNGRFTYFYPDGDIETTGRFSEDKREGLWLRFAQNQQLVDSSVYKAGRVIGTALKWNNAGQLTDSLVLNADGIGTRLSWFGDGTIASQGTFSAGQKQNGTWTYYHRSTGEKSSVEQYKDGLLVNRQYFSVSGAPVSDTSNTEKDASFPGEKGAWQTYLLSRLTLPANYKIENSDRAVVVVSFVINEEGQVEEAFASSPFHPAFDKIALDIIRASPKWNPAMDAHNRKVKAYRRQPVTFVQTRR